MCRRKGKVDSCGTLPDTSIGTELHNALLSIFKSQVKNNMYILLPFFFLSEIYIFFLGSGTHYQGEDGGKQAKNICGETVLKGVSEMCEEGWLPSEEGGMNGARNTQNPQSYFT